MSSHKDWGNNERIRRDEHLKGIKSVTKKWTLVNYEIASGGVDVLP
jgi:hypothetical protein